MSELYSDTKKRLDDDLKAERDSARVSANIVVSSHFRIEDEVQVVTGVFPTSTSIGDVMRWAKTCRYTYMRKPTPFKVIISMDDTDLAGDERD